jgi:DNA-binding NarL/FixJ family response regulator
VRERILIVSDYPAACRKLRRLLERGEMSVVGEAHTEEEATAVIDGCPLDAVVVSVELGAADGIKLASRIAQHNGVPVLITSSHDESIYAERALRAGVRGFIMKGERRDVLLRAIDTVARGDVYLSERMRNVLISRMSAERGPL